METKPKLRCAATTWSAHDQLATAYYTSCISVSLSLLSLGSVDIEGLYTHTQDLDSSQHHHVFFVGFGAHPLGLDGFLHVMHPNIVRIGVAPEAPCLNKARFAFGHASCDEIHTDCPARAEGEVG